MSDHHYKFNVTMTCGGCSGAVERVLKKLEGTSALYLTLIPLLDYIYNCVFCGAMLTKSTGVKEYTVSLDTQSADVTTADSVPYETVLEKIKKTGKTVNSGEADGVAMAV
jgi:copper chaperone